MQKILIYLTAAALLGGCAYRMDIQQGNVVTQEKFDQLQTGMSDKQVRHLLGSPLLTDAFHAGRWDYYYSLKRQGEPKTTYRVTLFFDNGKLARITKVGTLPTKDYVVEGEPAGQ